MRSAIVIVVAGLVLGALPMAAFDGTLPQQAMIYNSDALRAAIAEGMSRAGAAMANAEDEAPQSRH